MQLVLRPVSTVSTYRPLLIACTWDRRSTARAAHRELRAGKADAVLARIGTLGEGRDKMATWFGLVRTIFPPPCSQLGGVFHHVPLFLRATGMVRWRVFVADAGGLDRWPRRSQAKNFGLSISTRRPT